MDQVLLKACMGKSVSGGGLNLQDFREEMAERFPNKAEKIREMNRKKLTAFCKRDKQIREDIEKAKDRYFLPGSPLKKKQKDYCRCLAHVSAKNPSQCYEGNNPEWKQGRKSKTCLNVYSVCTKSAKRKGRFHCLKYYDLDNIPPDEVESISALHGKTVQETRKYIQDEHKQQSWKNPNY